MVGKKYFICFQTKEGCESLQGNLYRYSTSSIGEAWFPNEKRMHMLWNSMEREYIHNVFQFSFP